MSLDQLYLLPLEQQLEILNGPAMAPPDGNLLRDFENPPNQNARALGIMVFCFALITIVFFLRLYSRLLVKRSLFFEDYLCVIAYILTVAYAGCCFNLLAKTGYFVHQWDVRVKHLARAFYMLHLASAFYALIVMIMKAAILLEWVRIFAVHGTAKSFKVTCYVVIALNVILYSSSFIVVNVSCKPHDKIWDPTIPGWCMKDKQIMDIISAALNIGSHIVIFALPQGVIWKLQLSTKKKLGVSIIFAVGLVALASSAVRLDVSIQFIRTDDKIYSLASLSLWVYAELTCIFLVFCIPTIPKIIVDKKIVSRISSSLQFRSDSSQKRSGAKVGSTSTESLHRRNDSKNNYKKITESDIALQHIDVWDSRASNQDRQRQRQQDYDHGSQSNEIMRTVVVSQASSSVQALQ